jgi:hypothetical protein
MTEVIYEVHRCDWLRCHDIHTEFHKCWYRQSNGDKERYRRRHSDRQQGNLLSLLLFFFQNKEIVLKIN